MAPPIKRDMNDPRLKNISAATIKMLTDMFGVDPSDSGEGSDKGKGKGKAKGKGPAGRPRGMPEAFTAMASMAAMAPELAAEGFKMDNPNFFPMDLRKLEPEKLGPDTIRLTGTLTAKVPIPRSMVPEGMLPDEMLASPAPEAAPEVVVEPPGAGESPVTPQGQMVPVTYEGVCGRRHPGINGGEGVKFTFPEWAPRMLCMPGYGHTPDTSETTCRFVARMAKRHIKDLLQFGTWDCQFCGDIVTTFNLVAISFLAPDVGTTSPVRRSVWSYCVPICRSAGYCDQKAARLAGEFRRAHLSGSIITSSGCCMQCNKTSDITLCKACKMIPYVKHPDSSSVPASVPAQIPLFYPFSIAPVTSFAI